MLDSERGKQTHLEANELSNPALISSHKSCFPGDSITEAMEGTGSRQASVSDAIRNNPESSWR